MSLFNSQTGLRGFPPKFPNKLHVFPRFCFFEKDCQVSWSGNQPQQRMDFLSFGAPPIGWRDPTLRTKLRQNAGSFELRSGWVVGWLGLVFSFQISSKGHDRKFWRVIFFQMGGGVFGVSSFRMLDHPGLKSSIWNVIFHQDLGVLLPSKIWTNIQMFLNDFWMHFVIVKTIRQNNQIWLENRQLQWCNASFYLEKVEDFQLQPTDRWGGGFPCRFCCFRKWSVLDTWIMFKFTVGVTHLVMESPNEKFAWWKFTESK